MNKIMKFIIVFLSTVLALELIKIGTWLMNQTDDLQFYLGCLLVSLVAFASGTILTKTVINIIKQINQKNN